MDAQPSGAEAPRRPGLLASLRALAANAVGLLRTRFELLAAELEEERLRVTQIVFFGALALVFCVLGVLLLTLFLILLFWDTHRLLVTGMLAAGYLGIAAGLGLAARGKARAKSTLFSASLAELAKDRDRLASTDVR